MIVYRELSSIENDLGIPIKTLYALSNSVGAHYHEKRIPKSDGGTRILSVPDKPLKSVQRAIADKLLAYEPVSVYAKAYKVGSSVRKNAACHVGKSKLLKLDIYKFFDSISYYSVKEKAFPKDKYSEKIRILLAMLCYKGDSLPQGAPTSPIISNIIMREFDERVGDWCLDRKIVYTRYCDDMTFSGDFDESAVIAFVSEGLKALGFILNEKKTRCIEKGSRKTVTGIVVNDKLNTSKDYRREIRQTMYYCLRFGVTEHINRTGSTQSPSEFLNSLLGKVNYVLQITPENSEFLSYRYELLEMIKDSK